MDSFPRVFPFAWPYRGKLLLSLVFALIVAAMWAINLSGTFLIVKVLLEGQSLRSYVSDQIDMSRTTVEGYRISLETLSDELEAAKAVDPESDHYHDILSKQSRKQRKLSAATQRLSMLTWVQSRILPWVPDDRFDTFAIILGVLLLFTALKGVAIFFQDVLIGNVVELSVMGIRKECFRNTLTLDYQSLSKSGTADLMSRFTYDFAMMTNGLTLLGGKIIREPLKAAACIVMAFYVNWQLTLMSLLFLPILGLVFYRYGRMLKQAGQRMMESMSQIYKSLEETFDSLKVVIAFNGARRHRQRFHQENKAYYTKAMKVVRIDALTSPTIELLGLLAVSVAVLPGAYLVLRNTQEIWGIRLSTTPMEVAELSMLYALLAGILDPARKLSSAYNRLKRSSAAIDRIFALIDQRPLVTEPESPRVLPRHSDSVCFDNVAFSYDDVESGKQHPFALNNVNLTIPAGEAVAVVGTNGSGKSTLVNLLPRFYDADIGAVLVDGIDIRSVRSRDLRSQIGVVTQETLLFDDTIYENIRYGKPQATREEVEAAARQAHVLQFLDELPDGFDTVVGEKGQRLSGGQRQRIAVARAILRDPTILILDEATSAVDALSENLIHSALKKFVKGRTTFIITHYVSPSILELISKIVVMEAGRVIAYGSHEKLLESCAAYKALFHAKSKKTEGDSSDSEEVAVETSAAADSYTHDEVQAVQQADRIVATDQDHQLHEPHVIPFSLARAKKPIEKASATGPGEPSGSDQEDNGDTRRRVP